MRPDPEMPHKPERSSECQHPVDNGQDRQENHVKRPECIDQEYEDPSSTCLDYAKRNEANHQWEEQPTHQDGETENEKFHVVDICRLIPLDSSVLAKRDAIEPGPNLS